MSDEWTMFDDEYDKGLANYHVGDRVVYTPFDFREDDEGVILRLFVEVGKESEARPPMIAEIWPHDTDPDEDDRNWPHYVPFPFAVHDLVARREERDAEEERSWDA